MAFGLIGGKAFQVSKISYMEMGGQRGNETFKGRVAGGVGFDNKQSREHGYSGKLLMLFALTLHGQTSPANLCHVL